MTTVSAQEEIFNMTDAERIAQLRSVLGIESSSNAICDASLPFSLGDTTCGAENELQTVVIGSRHDVDLPLSIEQSNFYKNIIKRTISGESPEKVIYNLQDYLNNNPENVWEHSWVRFPLSVLNSYARSMLDYDLRCEKSNPHAGRRSDVDRFLFYAQGEEFIRIPVSYLLKLVLADVIGSGAIHPLLEPTAKRMMEHFLNDNTSPEIYSFYTVSLSSEKKNNVGIADETLQRYLLTQLLTLYAYKHFRLGELGQQPLVYFAPHPPIRQRYLNSLVSDSFYRELFMSPCLSGWDRGEEKYHYMILCHQTLSRSHLNTLAKLKEAGIITRNFIVIPNVSNISLANNGTHISIGSRKLSSLLSSANSGMTAALEKYWGDLVIKIVEHFLSLFVGTYSAAPYRFDYADFHPEQVLGFLPHELDYTHLRKMWRRWKKKAAITICGKPVTPSGFTTFDMLVSRLFRLRGDFISDFRLIDYLVSLLSTDQSPALDGRMGNDIRLKKDLAELGIFDAKMSLYLLYKQRQFATMGFSGFEGRYYSLFESLTGDMEPAALLQTLITALAFKYIVNGEVTHSHIPDTPTIESERRQIFFGAAIGIPTFFVRRDTKNIFLKRILALTEKIRQSHRYPGYLRVYNREFRKALVRVLRQDAADLIELLGLEHTVQDLEQRLAHDELTAAHRITNGILRQTGAATPLQLSSSEFNAAAERYYRETLRRRHIIEAFGRLEYTLTMLRDERHPADEVLRCRYASEHPSQVLSSLREKLLSDEVDEKTIIAAIEMVIACIHFHAVPEQQQKEIPHSIPAYELASAPVY